MDSQDCTILDLSTSVVEVKLRIRTPPGMRDEKLSLYLFLQRSRARPRELGGPDHQLQREAGWAL